MTLTRRGKAVAGAVVVSLAMAGLWGPRSLNAVVAPGVVALAAAWLTTRRVSRPGVERVVPEDGFVGERHAVTLAVDTGSSFAARLHDEVSDGLDADGNDVATTIDGDPIEYELRYTSRGEHTIGPLSIRVRDVLGLAERTFTYAGTETLLVYPPVRNLGTAARQELQALPEFRLVSMRGEFDSLRQYERGDAMRDIDWKSSAKQPDEQLIVKDYTDEDDLGAIGIVAEAERGAADAMAEATASVAAFLLEANLTVSVSAPEGVVDPGSGRHQRRQVLELLARTSGGHVPETERHDADIHVQAHADGAVTVRIEDSDVDFETLAGGPTPAATDASEA